MAAAAAPDSNLIASIAASLNNSAYIPSTINKSNLIVVPPSSQNKKVEPSKSYYEQITGMYDKMTKPNTYKRIYEKIRNSVTKRAKMPEILKNIGALPQDFKQDWEKLPPNEKLKYKMMFISSGLLGATLLVSRLRKGGAVAVAVTKTRRRNGKALKQKTRNRRRK